MVATTATIGVHALITTDFLCNQQLTCVTAKEELKDKLNIKFYFFYFDIIDEECVKIANQGGGMPIVSLEKMKKQKRDTILLFMVLSISFAFSLVSLSIMKSMDKTNEEYRYSVYGEWDAAFLDGQEKDSDFLKSDPD